MDDTYNPGLEMDSAYYNSDEDDENLSSYITDVLLHCARAACLDKAQQTDPVGPDEEPNDAVSDLLDDAIESVKRANVNLYQLYTSEGGDERALEGEFVAYDGDKSSSDDDVPPSGSLHDLLQMRHFTIRIPEQRRSSVGLERLDQQPSSEPQLDDLGIDQMTWTSQAIPGTSCSDTQISCHTRKHRKTTESLPQIIRTTRSRSDFVVTTEKADNTRSGESAGDSVEVEAAKQTETLRDLKAQISSLVTSRKEERLDAFSKARSLFVDEIGQLREQIGILEGRTDFLRFDQERLLRQLWAQDLEHEEATSSMYREIASLRKQVVTLTSDKIHLSRKFGKRLTQSLLNAKDEATNAISLLRAREQKVSDLKQLVLRQQKYVVDLERCLSDSEMTRYRRHLTERSTRRDAAIQQLIDGLYVDVQAATQKDEFTFRHYPCRAKGEEGDASMISDVLNVSRHATDEKEHPWHTDHAMAHALRFEGYRELWYPVIPQQDPNDLPYVRYQMAREQQRHRKGLPPREMDPVALTKHLVERLRDVSFLLSRDLCWPGIQELMAALE